MVEYPRGISQMMAPNDIEADAQAMAWVASLRDRWRLQILAKRARIGKDGRKTDVPTRIRRFVEGIPWSRVKPAVDALLAMAPYEGVIANGVDFGVPYRPTLTVWQRDAQSSALGAVRPDATYTLVQDLVEDTSKDFYAVGSSSSCSESVETEYVWDAGSVEGLRQGGQGVTYGIAAVNRKEDGTFDYQVVRRQALTQHVEETVVRDDSAGRVTQELWDNVYTDGDGNYVDHAGARLSIPEAGVADGVATRIENLSENPDCTLKFQVVRESSNDVESAESCGKTVFEHEHSTTRTGQDAPDGHVPDAGGGVRYESESRLQPDGTFVNVLKQTDEIPQESGLDIRRTTRATVTTVTTRNTGQTAEEPGRPGERQSHEMTPGGRYNLTVTTAEPSSEPDSARCSATVFEHVHDTVTMEDALDGSAEASAGGGQTQEIVQDMDEYGVVKKVVRTTTERQAAGAVTETEARLRGTITTTVNRNMEEKADEANLPVGTSVRNEQTPGGRWTQTIREMTGKVAGKIREMCRKTVFRHVHATTTNVVEDPGFDHEESAGDGVVRETDVQKTDMDTFDVTTTETTEQPVQGAVTETRKFIDGTVTRTVNLSQPSKASEEELDVGDSVKNEKTDGGLWNQTIERSAAGAAGVIVETCENTALVHSHARTTGMGKVDRPTAEVTAGDGTVRSKRVRKTDRGAWEVTSEDRTAKPATAEADGGTRNRTVHVVSYRNAQEVNPGSGGENEEIDVSLQRNEFGLVDGAVRRTTYAKTMGRSVAKGAMRAKQSVTVTRNDPDQEASEAPAKNKTVEVSVSPNDHGTFDKTVRVTDFEAATEVAVGGTMLYSEERTVSTNTEDGATWTPTQGTVYDVSAEPNDHGTKRLVVTRRTAIPQSTSHTWTSVEKNARSILTYERGVFVYQNQQNIVEPAGSWDSKSLSGLGVNQYGLLDYVWSCSTLTGIQDNSGGGGGTGNIRIDSEQVTTEYYTNVIVKNSNGKREMKAATCAFTATRVISTAQDFDGVFQQYLASEEMSQVGWKPEFRAYNNHYVAVAYKGITAVGQNGQRWRLSDSGVLLEQ